MTRRFRVVLLLVGCLSWPLISRAQSQESGDEVSVRELSIPPKARHAFQQGMNLLARKDAEGSLPHFQHAIAEFARYYEAYYMMGKADLKLWRLSDAELAFRKSIDLSGAQYAQPLLALSAILLDQGKFGEAESASRKGLDLNPVSWSGHYYLGSALFGLNRLEDAEKSVREAIRQKADSAAVWRLLVDIHARECNYSALLVDLEQYLKLDPDSPSGAKARALQESVRRILLESQSNATLALPQS
jgi:tetratricopeptide (TPR) repeat protein